jgi:hypothetical protein
MAALPVPAGWPPRSAGPAPAPIAIRPSTLRLAAWASVQATARAGAGTTPGRGLTRVLGSDRSARRPTQPDVRHRGRADRDRRMTLRVHVGSRVSWRVGQRARRPRPDGAPTSNRPSTSLARLAYRVASTARARPSSSGTSGTPLFGMGVFRYMTAWLHCSTDTLHCPRGNIDIWSRRVIAKLAVNGLGVRDLGDARA